MAAPVLTAESKTAPSNWAKAARRWLFSLLAVVIGSLILARHVPSLAIALGLAVMAVAVVYLADQSVRMRVDRMLGRQRSRRWVGTSLAVAAGIWGGLILFGFGLFVATGGIERAEAAKAATEAAARADVERQRLADVAAQQLAADEKLKVAEAAAASGRFEEAKRIADEVHAESPMHPGTEGVLQKVTDGQQRQLIAALPAKLTEIEAKVGAEQWSAAGAICEEVEPVASGNAALVSVCDRVGVQLRKAAVAGWIFEAREVAAQECDTPKSIADAWTNLRKVGEDDEGYAVAKKVATALEKCRKKAEKEFDAALRGVMVAQRERRASEIEATMLESGIDWSVTLRGKYKDQMRIEWILLGRVAVHQMTKDGELIAGLQKIGFKRVVFTDGYYESYTYDLEPDSEDGGGKIALKGLGLDQPIKM